MADTDNKSDDDDFGDENNGNNAHDETTPTTAVDDEMEDEEDEEEEEEDEEEEDEEEEEDDKPLRRSVKRKGGLKGNVSKRVNPRSLFDDQAEVSDGEEEDLEAEEGYQYLERERLNKTGTGEDSTSNLYQKNDKLNYNNFLDNLEERFASEPVKPVPTPIVRKPIKQIPIPDKSPVEADERISIRRHEEQQAVVSQYNTSRMLPTIHDPKIFSVRVRRGAEMQAVLSLTYKYNEYESRRIDKGSSVNETYIFSAFWTGQEGIVYVEAYDETMVRRVVEGMSLFLSGYKGAFQLMPIEGRSLLLEIPQINRPVALNSFVRFKKTLYKGDLGQIVRLNEDDQRVVCRLVPRLDLSQYTGGSYSAAHVRPEQRHFDTSKIPEKDVQRKSVSRLGGMFFEYQHQYFRDGMLYKEFSTSDILQDVQPLDEERKMFENKKTRDPADLFGQEDVEEEERPHEVIASNPTLSSSSQRLFFKGDVVRIISGELRHLEGLVEEFDRMRHEVSVQVQVDGTPLSLCLKDTEVMKIFANGTHVKILSGPNAGDTGMVVMTEKDGGDGPMSALIVSDFGDKEMKVFINYLTETAEVSSGLTCVSGFELYDLVAIPGGKVGVITQLASHSLTILDQTGKVRNMDVKLIRTKKNNISRSSAVMDVKQNQLREGDAVLIVEGDHKGRSGTVKRIWRNFVYIGFKDITENGGVVVVRNRQVEMDMDNMPKKQKDNKESIESMNLRPGAIDFSSTKRGSRNVKDLLKDGREVIVKEGRFRGLRGYVFDSNETEVKILFHSRPKPVSVPRLYVMPADSSGADCSDMDFARMHSLQTTLPPMRNYGTSSQPEPWQPLAYSPPSSEFDSVPVMPQLRLESWCAVGVKIKVLKGEFQHGKGVLLRCDDPENCKVLLDGLGERYMSIADVGPVLASKNGEEVMIFDSDLDHVRTVVERVDGGDLMVKVDGNFKLVRNAVVIDPAYFGH